MKSPQNSDLPPIQLYDLQLIHKMCRGNEEKVAEMVEVFIDQVSQFIQEIMSAYSEKDFSRIKSLVHKTKPTLTYFGTITLEKELLYIEDLLIKESQPSELDLKILSFKNLTNEVVDKMKNDFNIIN
ncbi:Hpt domain-containing protein [Flavobacterium sp.]|uniref:Hpt domain-containing protein n=1 Tax=Flavobacterium sp. TaxID=239 RepID=UPI0037935174